MIKKQNGHSEDYISPMLTVSTVVCESGFAVSNEGLTEESWSWNE